MDPSAAKSTDLERVLADIVPEVHLELKDICRELFALESGRFHSKADGSSVSELEKKLEIRTAEFLMDKTQGIRIIGEEGFRYEPERHTELTWLIDPIDGTVSFRNGFDTFGYCVTLVHGRDPIAAFVHFPKKGLTVEAILGGGLIVNGSAYEQPPSDIGKHSVIAVSDDYTFSEVGREHLLRAIRAQSDFIVRTYTDIYAHCLVALGQCVMKIDAACATWDRCPAELLVKESGGLTAFHAVENPTEDLAGTLLVLRPEFEPHVGRVLTQDNIKLFSL